KNEGGEERSDFLRRLAGAKELPSLPELERLWQELLREMISSSQVVQYRTSVLQLDKTVAEDVPVIRLGPFNAVAGGAYLGYLPGEKSLTALSANLTPPYPAIARDLEDAVGRQGY